MDLMDVARANAYTRNYVNNHSIGETECGKWIDGKPIYQKVLVFANPTTILANTTSATFSDEDFSEIESLVNANVIRKKGASASPCVVNCYANIASEHVITFASVLDVSNCTHVMLEYTKTTD